jgi:AraC-like DNA-binding protein
MIGLIGSDCASFRALPVLLGVWLSERRLERGALRAYLPCRLHRSGTGASTMPADHVDLVHAIVDGQAPATIDTGVSTSWQRSARAFGVDPDAKGPPRVLTANELKDFREPLARIIRDAQEELDRLYKVVERGRYSVLLCDHKGLVVDHRGDPAQAKDFMYWGTWLGGVWSEAIEGTNGIGTCVTEQRPVTIHQGQHFRSRHTSLSCSGAPIFDADGKLVAVVDVSSIDPTLSEQSHALTGPLTELSAQAIGERTFREKFRRDWIVAVAPDGELGSAILLAVDADRHIVGADRGARRLFAAADSDLAKGVSLWTLFDRDDALFRDRDRGDLSTRLAPTGGAERWPALITPPDHPSRMRRMPELARLHTRPRLIELCRQPQHAPREEVRGGLTPVVLKRVLDYIETHLDENIDLATLAATAGLSLFHFARAFKISKGMTPHSYILHRRVERAQRLLRETNLPQAEIAPLGVL